VSLGFVSHRVIHLLSLLWVAGLIEDLLIVDYFMGGHDELWLRTPLVIGDIVPCLEPYPLLTLGEEPVVAGCAFSGLHE